MQEKIKQLEEEIKNLHYNPQRNKEGFSAEKTKETFSNFWDYHMLFVIQKSRKLAKKYGANEEVAWLSAILHDIARLDEAEPHDEIGSEKAFELLLGKDFDEKIANEVKQVILTHRCRKYPPENLEQKILATADAMSHFLTPFYIWVAKEWGDGGRRQSMSEMLEFNLKKIERDYSQKIFFEEEREEVKKIYEVLIDWCKYKA